METPSIGKNVDSWCTKCKLMLAHTVETKVGNKITRVHCNTCGAQHAYRQNPPGTRSTRAASARPSAARRGRGEVDARDYETLLKGRDASAARRYAISERFRETELIAHPNFGLGLVTADKGDNKIEVLFADGPKTLVHGR